MSVNIGIEGPGHVGSAIRQAHVHQIGAHAGLLTFTQSFLNFDPEVHPFLNPTNGVAMNQNVSFGGTQEIIHNGGSTTEWTGSAIQGTWDFSTSGVVTNSSVDDNDEATFAEETPTTIDLGSFLVFTGKINLTTYNGINNTISIFWDNAGTQVGDTINLNDFIDVNLLGSAQNFAIALTNFNLLTNTVDGFTIRLGRTGGAKPSMTFDDLTLQQTGTPLEYIANTPLGTRFHITELRIAMADNETGKVAISGSTQTHSMVNLSYDKIMSISALANGVILKSVQSGKTSFSVTLKQLGDFLLAGGDLINVISDGTNTFLTLRVTFPDPIVIEGNTGDFLSFIINDNLSSLLQFTAVARGAIEI